MLDFLSNTVITWPAAIVMALALVWLIFTARAKALDNARKELEDAKKAYKYSLDYELPAAAVRSRHRRVRELQAKIERLGG